MERRAGAPRKAPPRDLPAWLREISLLSDAATNIEATSFLVWWQDGAGELLADVMAAFHAVGLGDRAELLDRARRAVDPRELAPDGGDSMVDGAVVSTSRADTVSDERFAELAEVERALQQAERTGPTLYDALLAHAAAGLAGAA